MDFNIHNPKRDPSESFEDYKTRRQISKRRAANSIANPPGQFGRPLRQAAQRATRRSNAKAGKDTGKHPKFAKASRVKKRYKPNIGSPFMGAKHRLRIRKWVSLAKRAEQKRGKADRAA